jgi:hypothetical protein
MIHEEIVTYEVAKLAKEKGFNEKCNFYYQKGVISTDGCFNRYNKGVEYICSAPTQSLLQRWLREEKGVTICVDIFDDGWFFDISTFYKQDTGVYEVDIPYKSSSVSPVYDTYELALEDAIKFTLKNLV